MRRRSAVSALAAAVAGLSLGEVPILPAMEPLPAGPFSVTPDNLAESSGLVTCPICGEMANALDLTPAGICLGCADRDPTLQAKPHSDPFWTLSPGEIRRVEQEIQRLAAKLDLIDGAVEANREEWHALQRELHLLQLLRAASRQFRG